MSASLHASRTLAPDVRFCRSADGVRIAYARHGAGLPLVVASCWLSHLSYDWESPVWRHFLDDLGSIATVIRYDERGFGLSDWDVDEFGLESRVADLEAVLDDCGLDRFALLGMAQGGPVAITYADRHPDRVSRLVMYGASACVDRELTAEQREYVDTLISMMRVGWARPESDFRRVFTNKFIPGANEEQMRWVDDLQRVSTSGRNAAESRRQRGAVDVTPLLGNLDVATLIMHARGDRMSPFAEGALMASHIPGARLVPLDSNNHILLADEPAWQVFIAELTDFLSPDAVLAATEQPGIAAGLATLSPRELDILRHAAAGAGNADIATAVTLSVRTVERHLSNVYLKLGLNGRSARTAAVAALLTNR